MLKKLTVKKVSNDHREFAERTANEPCQLGCRAVCGAGDPEYYADTWIADLNDQILIGECG